MTQVEGENHHTRTQHTLQAEGIIKLQSTPIPPAYPPLSKQTHLLPPLTSDELQSQEMVPEFMGMDCSKDVMKKIWPASC